MGSSGSGKLTLLNILGILDEADFGNYNLDTVHVKVGNQVIESNNFNEGKTIASVADVGRMIFVGKIDELEVDKIKKNTHRNYHWRYRKQKI